MSPEELEHVLNHQMKTMEEQREQALVNELVLKNNLETSRVSLGFINGKIAQLKETLAKLKS
jgi:hypothetical protein